MSALQIGKDRIVLTGIAKVEDAEPLLAALLDHPAYPVDVDGLEHAHFAVVQLLHAARRPLCGQPNAALLSGMALTCLMTSKA